MENWQEEPDQEELRKENIRINKVVNLDASFDTSTLEAAAADRDTWRARVYDGVTQF